MKQLFDAGAIDANSTQLNLTGETFQRLTLFGSNPVQMDLQIPPGPPIMGLGAGQPGN